MINLKLLKAELSDVILPKNNKKFMNKKFKNKKQKL